MFELIKIAFLTSGLARIVNAIAYVCAAPPALTSFRELPLPTPGNALRSDAVFVDHKILRLAS